MLNQWENFLFESSIIIVNRILVIKNVNLNKDLKIKNKNDPQIGISKRIPCLFSICGVKTFVMLKC